MPTVLRFFALVLCTVPLLGCSTGDMHHMRWNNGWDKNFSFNYISFDQAEGGYPDQIDADDFAGAGLDSYHVADNPGVFYRSLDITEGTRITLVVFPPQSENGIVIVRGAAGGDASVLHTSTGMTVTTQMFWHHGIDWAQMARKYGYGEYSVGWYWNDDRQASALHRFELVP